MLYLDYRWDLSPELIVLDEELNTDGLGWNPGDYFKVVKRNGRTVLVKVDPLTAFIREGAEDVVDQNNKVKINVDEKYG